MHTFILWNSNTISLEYNELFISTLGIRILLTRTYLHQSERSERAARAQCQ